MSKSAASAETGLKATSEAARALNSKAFARMKANPKADWTIQDIQQICKQMTMICTPPTRGSHFKVSSPVVSGSLTVPKARPIKTPYIRSFIGLVEAHLRFSSENGENNG